MVVDPFRDTSLPPFRSDTAPALSDERLAAAERDLLRQPTDYATLAPRLEDFKELARVLSGHLERRHPVAPFLQDVERTFPARFAAAAQDREGLTDDDFLTFDVVHLLFLRLARNALLAGKRFAEFDLLPPAFIRRVADSLVARPVEPASLMTRQRLLGLFVELLPSSLVDADAVMAFRGSLGSLPYLPYQEQYMSLDACVRDLAGVLAAEPPATVAPTVAPPPPPTPTPTPTPPPTPTPTVQSTPPPTATPAPPPAADGSRWPAVMLTLVAFAVGVGVARFSASRSTVPTLPAADVTSAGDTVDESSIVTLPGLKSHRLPDGLTERYEDITFLGCGAMGTVYSAHDGLLRRRVALKVMHPALRTTVPDAHERFLREARALAKLSHPNIIGIYDVHAGDDPWFSMELLEGRSLDALVGDGDRLSNERSLELARALGSALACVHEANMVHRDVKPAHVFFSSEGVKLLDFGIAKPDETELTAAGKLVGTPRFMAPEVLYGGKKATPRSDVYALGIVLYTALTGQHPFGPTNLPSKQFEIRPPSSFDPTVDRRWDDVLLACLQLDPLLRPADGAEFVRRLAVFDVDAEAGASTIGTLRTLHDIHAVQLHALAGQLSVAERIDDDWQDVLETLTQGSYIDSVGELLAKLGERVRSLHTEIGTPPPGPLADTLGTLVDGLATFDDDVEALYRFGDEFFTIADEVESGIGSTADRDARRRRLTQLTKDTLARLHQRYAGLSRAVKEQLRRMQVDLADVLAERLGRRGDLNGRVSFMRGEATVAVAKAERGAEDLATVVDIILDNAQQAGAKRVTWTCRELLDDDVVEVACEDDGVGLGATPPERLFEDGFTTRQAGSGTGLAKARRLLARHGGTISIGPREGAAGARVALRLFVV